MFGANKPTFGATSTPSFGFNSGQQSSPFGQTTSAFGKPAAATFGQPATSFGQQNTTSVFGASAAQQPTGGLFGSTQPQTGAGFGSFGQQSTSIFGQNNAPTSLFGGSNTTSAFGAKPTGFSGFGATNTSAFSTTPQPQTTGLFGQTAAPATGGLFGSTTTTQPTAFGQPQAIGVGSNGTAIAKYQPQLSTDTLLKGGQTNSVSTKQHCITFMKEYETKSLEELRLEDYQANRKGPQAGTSSSLFGPPQQTTGLFGQTSAAPNTTGGLFGSTNTGLGGTTFGQNTSTFGQTNAGGLFGKPAFSTPATTASTFAFGNTSNTTTSPFGVAKPFGQTQPTSTFGQPANNSFGSFGQTSTFGQQPQQQQPQQTTSLFGQPQASTAQQPTFGLGTSTAQTSFGGFGAPATSTTATGLFNKPATSFGTTPAFGQPATTSTSLFGTTNTGTSLFSNSFNKPAAPSFGFGQPATSQAPLGGGLGLNTQNTLFGNQANKPTGLFGNTSTTGGLFSSAPAFGTNTGLSMGTTNNFGNTMMGQPQQPAAVPIHQQILSLASNPYGDNPIFKDLKPSSMTNEDSLKPTNPAAQKAVLETSNHFKISPKSTSKIKVKPVGNIVSKKSLFDGLEEYDSTLEESFSAKPNAKRLIIKPKSSPAPNSSGNASSLNISLKSKPVVEQSIGLEQETNRDDVEVFTNQIPLNPISDNNADNGRRVSWLRTAPLPQANCLRQSQKNLDSTIKELQTEKENKRSDDKPTTLPAPTHSPDVSLSNESFLSNHNLDETANDADLSLIGSAEPHPTGIVLRRPGYYIIPNLDELTEYLDEEGRCIVPNFTIGRKGYGNVFFNESIDVAGLNLDEIVHFRHKEVILYPDDENKPAVGQGLNRKAQVTLDQVWPHDKTRHESIKDPARLEAMDYESKLRRVCEKHDTKFLEYRADTGSCVFKVEHFSKYTLDDSDEDDTPVDPKKAKMGVVAPVAAKDPQQIVKPTAVQANQPKQQETLNFLGQHMGQRTFQQFMIEDDMDLSQDAPTSPSMALAKEMKTDSHKLQLMKASFFVDEEYETISVASEMTEGRETPDQTVPTIKAMLAPSFLGKMDSVTSMLSHETEAQEKEDTVMEKQPEVMIPSFIMKPIGPKSLPLIVRPRVMQFNISEISLPLEDSILHQMIGKKGNNLTFFSGRKFRMGWSGRNMLTALNTLQNYNDQQQCMKLKNVFGGRDQQDNSPAVIQMIQVKSMQRESPELFRKSIEDHLKIEFKHDKKQQGVNSDCPYLEADGGTSALDEHFEVARKLAQETKRDAELYNESVWSLMCALWGFREELEDEDPSSHRSVMFRRDLFSMWIESVVTDKDFLKKNQVYLDRLLDLILCHKVSSACDLAFQNDDVNLSMLISQISGGPTVRQLLQHQLSIWQDVEADKFVDVKRLKVLMCISGVPALNSSHGIINIFEDLDWIKCLALQLWYMCSPISSVTDALIAYENSFESDEMMMVSQPIPGYTKIYDMTKKLFDLRYHLLKLYSVRSHPLETLLHPANYTPDICDYRMSFLLLQQLESLGYRHCSELCKCKIYTSFAEQLENYGMWHWAIYVLLHIPNQSQRELTVQQLLYRYIRIDGEQHSDNVEYSAKERFIVDELNIPEKWIFWAKAVRAGAFHNYHVQAKYLLKARQWSQAHEIIMQHIAPDAIINDNISYLKSLLQQFEEIKQIANWSIQGQILVDFIELSEKFDFLQENSDNVMEEDVELFLEQLKPKLSDLCSTIKLFPCPTSKHRLCQSEISQKLAFIIRAFYATSPNNAEDPCALMRIALEKLPLSQEYARQELRHILTAFLKEKLTIN